MQKDKGEGFSLSSVYSVFIVVVALVGMNMPMLDGVLSGVLLFSEWVLYAGLSYSTGELLVRGMVSLKSMQRQKELTN